MPNFKKASRNLFFSRAFKAFLGYGGLIYFTKVLGASLLGIYFLFFAVSNLIAFFCNMGISSAMAKRVSENKEQTEKSKLTGAGLALQIILFSIIFLLAFIFRNSINNYIGASLFFFVILAAALLQLKRYIEGNLRGRKKINKVALMTIIEGVGTILFSVIFLVSGMKLYGLIYGLLIGHFLSIIIGGLYLDIKPLFPAKRQFQKIIKFAKYSTFLGLGGMIYNWTSVFIIGLFLTKTEVGVFQSAWKISLVTVMASKAIATTVLPQISDFSSRGKNKKIESLLKKAIVFAPLIPIGAFMGSLVVSKDIMRIFGKEFVFGWFVLILLLLDKIFTSILNIFGSALGGVDRPDLTLRARVISIISYIFLAFLLIPTLGITGGALAVLVSFLIDTIIAGVYLNKIIPFKIPFNKLGWQFLAGAIMCAVMFPLKIVGGWSLSWIQLGAVVVLGSGAYFAVILTNKSLKADISPLFNKIPLIKRINL